MRVTVTLTHARIMLIVMEVRDPLFNVKMGSGVRRNDDVIA
jgi:hypothetical protein